VGDTSLPQSDTLIDDFLRDTPIVLISTQMSSRPEHAKYEGFSARRLIEEFRKSAFGAFAVSKMLREDEMDEAKNSTTTEVGHKEDEGVFVLHALVNILKQVEKKLFELLKVISDDLDDDVPFGNQSCKDWLQSHLNRTLRVPRT
jgi:hypothetical protein